MSSLLLSPHGPKHTGHVPVHGNFSHSLIHSLIHYTYEALEIAGGRASDMAPTLDPHLSLLPSSSGLPLSLSESKAICVLCCFSQLLSTTLLPFIYPFTKKAGDVITAIALEDLLWEVL